MYTLKERYYDSRKASFCSIDEGLISSYDMTKCENALKSRFSSVVSVINRSTNKYRLPMWKDDGKNMGNFEIVLSSLDELNEICKYVEFAYGWFPSILEVDGSEFVDWSRDGNFKYINGGAFNDMNLYTYLRNYHKGGISKISLFVEAKFTVEDFNITELYHVTDLKYLDKIRKNGLVPKSKGNFTERIYFGKDLNDIKAIFENRFSEPLILRLNFDEYGKEILDKYVFYKDPRMESAVFTYDCIDPKYIQMVDENSKDSICYVFKNII